MDVSPDSIERIRREIDFDDPPSLTYFGTSPQRRLSRLARDIASEDTVQAIEDTDESLQEALELLQRRPSKWRDSLSKFFSILPFKNAARRYKEMTQRLGASLTKLQAQRAKFNEWQNTLEEIEVDLKVHLEAGKLAISSDDSHEHAHRLQMRLNDLATSLQVVGLVRDGLAQRRHNYALLTEQLNSLLGSGAAAWNAQRAGSVAKGTTDFQELRQLAEACQAADKTWRESLPDPASLPDST